MSERKVAAADQKRVRAFNSEVLTLEKTSLHLKTVVRLMTEVIKRCG